MITTKDRQILWELAKCVKEIANLDIMRERREKWTQHNDLKSIEPLIAVFPEGAWDELLPWSGLYCENDEARRVEMHLRQSPNNPRGAYIIEPLLKSIDDILMLRVPKLQYDEPATLADLAEKQDLFGDILDVKLIHAITTHTGSLSG